MRQSIGLENRDQIIRDLESLALGKYIEEIVSATAEGATRCKTERDSWSAVEVCPMNEYIHKASATVVCCLESLDNLNLTSALPRELHTPSSIFSGAVSHSPLQGTSCNLDSRTARKG
jgi:hypothetical protein